MYPAPSSAYRPQLPQQSTQFIPQTTNQNVHPPPPVPTASGTYPYPQHNHHLNSPASGHPGQPTLYPQPMPYAMGGSVASATNQQNNNLNGPLSVRMSLSFYSKRFDFFFQNNDMVDLLKEKSVVSAYAEEPPISPLLNEENQQMNCNPEYVIIIN
jgi:hypothetical protein